MPCIRQFPWCGGCTFYRAPVCTRLLTLMDDEKDTAGAVLIIPLPPEGRARPLPTRTAAPITWAGRLGAAGHRLAIMHLVAPTNSSTVPANESRLSKARTTRHLVRLRINPKMLCHRLFLHMSA